MDYSAVESSESSAGTQAPILPRQDSGRQNGVKLQDSQPGVHSRRPTGEPVTRSNSRRSFIVRAATSMLQPERPIEGPPPTVFQSLKAIIAATWLNVLLVCIPISWILHFVTPKSDTIIFIFSFLAIIPLAKLLAFSTDELSMRVGQTLAGLLNATLGNAVELIVAIIALVKCELSIVQSSLIGSILSNLLLVLGMCFFAGGTRFSEQGFGVTSSQLNSSLLTISVIAVLLPAAFHLALQDPSDTTSNADEGKDILKLSHGVALILLFIYGSYLVFQLYSHAALYEHAEANFQSTQYPKKHKKDKHDDAPTGSETSTPWSRHFHLPVRSGTVASGVVTQRSNTITSSVPTHDTETAVDHPRTTTPEPDLGTKECVAPVVDVERNAGAEDDDEVEKPQLSVTVTVGLLVVVTVLVAVTAEFLVSSIDGLTEGGKISKEFVGIILLPIVGNAAEHVTAVTVSVKDKLTLSLGVAVGSSIQIALFVIPFIVTLGWILGKPLTLLFDPYESITMFLAVLTVNYVVQDGKSNWLEGMILMCLYLILGVTFWFYPGSQSSVQQMCH